MWIFVILTERRKIMEDIIMLIFTIIALIEFFDFLF